MFFEVYTQSAPSNNLNRSKTEKGQKFLSSNDQELNCDQRKHSLPTMDPKIPEILSPSKLFPKTF